MFDRRLPLVVTVLLICMAGQVSAKDRLWRHYTELETRGGDEFWAGQGSLFLPLHETEVSLLFADLRGNWTDEQAAHGNLGLAFRQMLIYDWIFGIHAAYDTRHSQFGNNFHQAMLGLELLSVNWGLRWNGYLAGEGPELLPDLNRVLLVGNNLFVQQASERAYSGQDFELERRLWYHQTPSDGSWTHWAHGQDVEIWGSVGIFNFDNDAPGFAHVTGPRARMELRFYDLPLAGPDSRLVFAGQYEHDDVRGSVGTGMLTLRIPFGRGTSRPRGLLRGLNRRMVAPIERNTDIVSLAGFESSEAATFASSGQAIAQVITVDANTANPEAVIAGAGNNSLVVVDGSAGTVLPGNTIGLQPGQVVMGGGGSLTLAGANSGATATFRAPGSRPTIDSVANTTFNAADNSTLLSLDIRNSGGGLTGILLNNHTGVSIDDVGINVTGPASIGIQSFGTSQFVVNNSWINTSGANGDGIQLFGSSVAAVRNTSIGTIGNDAHGLFLTGDSFLNLGGSQVFTSGAIGAEGIFATGNSQLIAANSVVTVTGPSTAAVLATPSVAADNLALLISNSTLSATDHAIVLGGAGFGTGTLNATLTGNTISAPVGSHEIEAVTNGAGAVLNLSAQGNGLDPTTGTIRLNEIAGDLNVTQSAPGTTAGGIDAANGLPATNVFIPGGAVDFDELPPPPPVAP